MTLSNVESVRDVDKLSEKWRQGEMPTLATLQTAERFVRDVDASNPLKCEEWERFRCGEWDIDTSHSLKYGDWEICRHYQHFEMR